MPSPARQPTGSPEPVNVHDFIDKELGKVTPYGIYDVAANAGWVSVGTDHDTAAFAVTTIARWWQAVGQPAYPAATRLLICADGGGSNGYRTRLWKTELAALAASTGLAITVCHLPPGTSKWNKIEHRLFSHISMNWRGRPLTSHEVVVQTIAATTTRTGLTITAELDTASYPKGIKISDRQITDLEQTHVLTRHQFHGEWNYTLSPPHDTPEPAELIHRKRLPRTTSSPRRQLMSSSLASPRATPSGRRPTWNVTARAGKTGDTAAPRYRRRPGRMARRKPRRARQPPFPTRRGTPMSQDAIEDGVKRHAAAAALTCPSLTSKNVTLHVLRHHAR